jgi:hypothetical protein
MPWGLNHPYPGEEDLYDNGGFYRLEGDTYVGIHPDTPALAKDELPATAVETPTVELMDAMSGTLQFPPDPRTGMDLMEGWFKITGIPEGNGLSDANELNNALFMFYYKIMGLPTEPWLAKDMKGEVELFFDEKVAATKAQLEEAFGDQIAVRSGYYTAVPGYTKHEVDVAGDFADDGFRKLLVSRETTDNNNYANEFMVLNYVKEELCEKNVLEDTEVHMTRQIGRTPEYNAMNVQHVRPYIEAHAPGSTIAMIYITHGLSWPGTYSTGRAMSTQHPWWKDVIHENSFLNYLSWKEALIKEFGDDYTLLFSLNDSELLRETFYAYGYFPDSRLDGKFNTLREAIQLAKQAGAEKMIAVPAHWHGDAQDTQYIMRHYAEIPLVPMADMQQGKFDLTFCEGAANAEVDCGSPDAETEITVTSSYNDLDEEFATVYAVRLRGGIERFGVYPKDEFFADNVSKALTKRTGGTVEVTDTVSAIHGAKIVVPEDPYPDFPETFEPDTAIAFSHPDTTYECMWNDTEIIVAQRTNPPVMEGALGPAVHFGPYRIVFNCDVTLTIPYDPSSAGDGAVGVSVYNHLTTSWEAVEVESYADGLVTFKTQFLGLFQASSVS